LKANGEPAATEASALAEKVVSPIVLVPKRAPKHQTVIIFDWDDTLLCTTWLNQYYKDKEVPEDVDRLLRKIAHKVTTLLETAVRSGHTYIITNATTGWVEYSAQKWIPEVMPVLQRVRIISARDKFEAMFPDDVDQWKVQAFLEVQRQLEWTPIANLVTLGDSHYEMEAARIMGEKFDEALLKTVMFQQSPNPVEHWRQLEAVSEKFLPILKAGKPLQIALARSKAPSQ